MKLLFKLLCVPLVFTALVMPLSKKQIEQVETISIRLERFSMKPILNEYLSRFEIDKTTADLHARELTRFLILCAISNDRVPLMSTHVGNLWEVFNQFKKEYAHFCTHIIGKTIKYNPCVKKGSVNFKEANKFFKDYEEAFEKSPSREVWNLLPKVK